jgi:hypothetical protein
MTTSLNGPRPEKSLAEHSSCGVNCLVACGIWSSCYYAIKGVKGKKTCCVVYGKSHHNKDWQRSLEKDYTIFRRELCSFWETMPNVWLKINIFFVRTNNIQIVVMDDRLVIYSDYLQKATRLPCWCEHLSTLTSLLWGRKQVRKLMTETDSGRPKKLAGKPGPKFRDAVFLQGPSLEGLSLSRAPELRMSCLDVVKCVLVARMWLLSAPQ